MLSWYYWYSIKYNSIPQKMHVFCLALEQVHYTRNFTFTEQFPLVCHSLSDLFIVPNYQMHWMDPLLSKQLSYNAKYLTMITSRWIYNIDVHGLIAQRKGKTFRVQEDGTTCNSKAANVVFICTNYITYIQKLYELLTRYSKYCFPYRLISTTIK